MSLTADRILILLQSREIKQRASSFHLSRLSIIDGSSSRLFELKKKKKKDNKVGDLCFMRFFSVFNCQSSLLCICLSTSFSIFPCLEVRRIYRMWRVASGGQTWERLGVWLPYHSLWLILWHSLHYPELYATIITPHPPARAGRPWPYRPIILPRRNVTEGTPDI